MVLNAVLGDYIPFLLSGFLETALLTAGGLALGFVIGVALAFAEVFLPRWAGAPASAVEQVLRGIPLLVMFLLLYLGLPSFGIILSPEVAAVVGLGLRSGGYQSQIFRSALGSIGVGQSEAALSIGLGRFEAYREILLPQALRISIPSWSNEFTVVLKDTSLAYSIGVSEIMARASNIIALTLQPLQVYLIVAAVYLVATIIINRGMNSIYEKLKIPGLGGGA
ncbi:MAG TPA: amino acid ABC transporter permease [Conexivisphaerales archaeon]|nr:amino acid ABC transporter permease [Conexivisphaerales archaeon]